MVVGRESDSRELGEGVTKSSREKFEERVFGKRRDYAVGGGDFEEGGEIWVCEGICD